MKFKLISIFSIVICLLVALSSCGPASPLVSEGSPAPDFTLTTISGESKSLSNFSGKSVLLVFEGRPCPNCDKQRPFIINALKTCGKDITVMTIFRPTINKPTPEYIKPHVDSEKIADYSLVLLDKDDIAAPKYGLGNATPNSIFIDSQGIIKKKQISPFISQQEIELLLKSL